MANLNKNQRWYLEGMQHALAVAQREGIEELEKEVAYRTGNVLPRNVSRTELTAVARGRAKEELMFVATAMATTLTDHIKMPPLVITDYLKHFNELIELYRIDKRRFESDQQRLDRNYAVNAACKQFLEGDTDGK